MLKGFRSKGFTLIEILVALGILGILAFVVFRSVTSSQAQAKDIKRKSDISQYQTALENFANRNNGKYPRSALVTQEKLCGYLGLTICPKDSQVDYYYSTGDSVSDGAAKAPSYAVWGGLASQPNYNWMGCSDGREGLSGTGAGSGGNLCTVGSTPAPTQAPVVSPTPTPISCAGQANGTYCLVSNPDVCGKQRQFMGVCENGSCVQPSAQCEGQADGTSCSISGCIVPTVGSCYTACTRPSRTGTCQNETCVTQ